MSSGRTQIASNDRALPWGALFPARVLPFELKLLAAVRPPWAPILTSALKVAGPSLKSAGKICGSSFGRSAFCKDVEDLLDLVGKDLTEHSSSPPRGSEILVFDVNEGELIQSLEAHKDTVYSVDFAISGKRFATRGADKQVPSRILTCSWTNDGQYFALGMFGGTISIRVKTGEEQALIERATVPIWSIQWCPAADKELGTAIVVLQLNGRQVGKDRVLGCDINYFSNGSMLRSVGQTRRTRSGRPKGSKSVQSAKEIAGFGAAKYAYRENMRDLVIEHLSTDQCARIKSRGYVKKIAVYKDRIAMQLSDRPEKIRLQRNLILQSPRRDITAHHSVFGEEAEDVRLQRSEWGLDSLIRFIKVIGVPRGKEGLWGGNRCKQWGEPFVYSHYYITKLPLVEFEPDPCISQEEALQLINTEPHVTDDGQNFVINAKLHPKTWVRVGLPLLHMVACWDNPTSMADISIHKLATKPHCVQRFLPLGLKSGQTGSTGEARKVNLIAVRVLDENDSEIFDGVLQGIESSIKAAARSGSSGNDPITTMGLDTANKNGVIVVVAAGNENQDACNTRPANAQSAVTVGAIDPRNDAMAFKLWTHLEWDIEPARRRWDHKHYFFGVNGKIVFNNGEAGFGGASCPIGSNKKRLPAHEPEL
ncbi:hypothetical protein BJ742DRAFT_739532 [Cladochytrium replicatum]|nr:hypothetical protein BJ742DRAFT_739532 [Cladochytrium replicatum]